MMCAKGGSAIARETRPGLSEKTVTVRDAYISAEARVDLKQFKDSRC